MSNQKKKVAKQAVLENPFLSAQNSIQNHQEITDTLVQVVSNIFPPAVSTKMALDTLDAEEKLKILKASKSERAAKLKDIKLKLRNADKEKLSQVVDRRNCISVGLKQCLKDLERKNLQILLFDKTANFPPIRALVDKDQLPVVGIPDLGQVLRRTIGFPALTIGIKNNAHEHFQPILKLVVNNAESKMGVDNVETHSVDNVEKPSVDKAHVQPAEGVARDEILSAVQQVSEDPGVNILFRKSKNSGRVFRPSTTTIDLSSTKKKKAEKSLDSDFISFSSDSKKADYKPSFISFK